MGARFYLKAKRRTWPKEKGTRLQIITKWLNLRKSATASQLESYAERSCNLRGIRIQQKF